MLTASGASVAESFAVIFRPAATSNASLSAKASAYIGQRPALRRLIDDLLPTDDDGTTKSKAGRPRKDSAVPSVAEVPEIDYRDKEALLKELAILAGRAEKDSDRLAAIREIGAFQRMKSEAKIEEDKRVCFYVPLSNSHCEALTSYLRRYFKESED